MDCMRGKGKAGVPLGYNRDILFQWRLIRKSGRNFRMQTASCTEEAQSQGPIFWMPLCKKEDGEDHREEYRKKLRQFHDRLYRDYQEYLSGERNVLFRMKEL